LHQKQFFRKRGGGGASRLRIGRRQVPEALEDCRRDQRGRGSVRIIRRRFCLLLRRRPRCASHYYYYYILLSNREHAEQLQRKRVFCVRVVFSSVSRLFSTRKKMYHQRSKISRSSFRILFISTTKKSLIHSSVNPSTWAPQKSAEKQTKFFFASETREREKRHSYDSSCDLLVNSYY